MQPYELSATEAAGLIAAGELSCEELARSTLMRIQECESAIRAWSYVNADEVVRNARELDKGMPRGALHGLTLGVKDMIDTFDMPTSHNSPIYYGHRPSKDAASVAIVRQRGAQILGKTETAEFAAGGRFPNTRNGRNPGYSPGASSSGSAAAVGAGMAQLALATQTGGSLIRPAAYNGIHGFKPTHGLVSTEGAKTFAPSLDTVGWYGRSVADLALMASVFRIAMPEERPGIRGLRVGLCRGPNWQHIEPGGEAALLAAARRLEDAGAIVEDLDLPDELERATALHGVLMRGEGRVSFFNEYVQHYPMLHEGMRSLVEGAVSSADLIQAHDGLAQCRRVFDGLFGKDLDVVITPPASGEAPLADAGPPPMTSAMVFCAMWTALHVPCVALPVGNGRDGLPLGVQLIGARGLDGRLLAISQNAAEAVTGDDVRY